MKTRRRNQKKKTVEKQCNSMSYLALTMTQSDNLNQRNGMF